MSATRNSTILGSIRHLMQNYKGLGGVPWYAAQWAAQGGGLTQEGTWSVTAPARCAVLDMPLALTGRGLQEAFAPSIDNTSRAHTKKTDHVPAHTRLICAELNVRQDDAIPDLRAAWTALLADVVADTERGLTPEGRTTLAASDDATRARLATNWANRANKAANGVTSKTKDRAAYNRQCQDLDVYAICNQACMNHRHADVACGRVTASPLTPQQMFDKWLASPRCALSGALMTIENGPRRISMDRVEYCTAHEAGTTRGICRLLNSRAGWTRRKWCTMVLAQGLVPLPPRVREVLEEELRLN
jgi:hypothetical protein